MSKLYLGTHQTSWLRTAKVPLFVSHRRLSPLKTLPVAAEVWALDSGGFSEISLYGEWRTTPREYVEAVRRYDSEIGKLEWAAPQDWMCEPDMLLKTGMSVEEHQKRTVANFVELCDLWGAKDCPFMPVLQGWAVDDYLHCVEVYEEFEVRLADHPLVGVGSVCRRQHSGEIAQVLREILATDPAMPIHGFGVKTLGLRIYGDLLTTSDSMAWSYDARRNRPMDGCTHLSCSNCIEWALEWRRKVIGPACEVHHECDGHFATCKKG